MVLLPPSKDRVMLTERPFSLERLPGDPDAAAIAVLTLAIRARWSVRELAKRTRVDFRPEAADYPRVIAVAFE
ncbi:MAG: hypothetical protein C0485_12725 [Pirellula sp.]|jgi:hypothetical protein|nr:hypothetical protein [Pirellula sp.]